VFALRAATGETELKNGLEMAVAYPNVLAGSPAHDLPFNGAGVTKATSSPEQTGTDQGHRWFALGIRPRHEKMAAMMLEHKGYESLLPLYKSRRRRPDRYREVHLPLFPGYLFCKFNPVVRLPILTTPGVVYVVGLGRIPIPIEESEIDSIRRLISSPLQPEPWPYLEMGQSVYIQDGPLQGIVGTLVSVKNSHRLVLSVTLLKRSVAVEIDRNWVVPATHRSGSVSGSGD